VLTGRCAGLILTWRRCCPISAVAGTTGGLQLMLAERAVQDPPPDIDHPDLALLLALGHWRTDT
jgi:hypothetical protein